MVAEGAEIKFQRLALDEEIARQIVDNEVGEVRLSGHRTDRSEFRTGEPHDVPFTGLRIGDPLQHCLVRRFR